VIDKLLEYQNKVPYVLKEKLPRMVEPDPIVLPDYEPSELTEQEIGENLILDEGPIMDEDINPFEDTIRTIESLDDVDLIFSHVDGLLDTLSNLTIEDKKRIQQKIQSTLKGSDDWRDVALVLIGALIVDGSYEITNLQSISKIILDKDDIRDNVIELLERIRPIPESNANALVKSLHDAINEKAQTNYQKNVLSTKIKKLERTILKDYSRRKTGQTDRSRQFKDTRGRGDRQSRRIRSTSRSRGKREQRLNEARKTKM